MKSYLFNGLKRDGQLDGFVSGLGVFAHLTDEDVSFLVDSFVLMKKTTSGPRIKGIHDQVVARFSQDLYLAEMAMNSISMLSQGISMDHAREGEANIILQDISEAFVDVDGGPRVVSVAATVIGALSQSRTEIDGEIKKLKAAQGVFPRVVAIGQTLELRAVLAEDPNTPIDETDVANYNPSFVDLIPIASIGIRTDTDETFLFQLDEESLGYLVNVLGVVQKQFAEIKKVAERAGVK